METLKYKIIKTREQYINYCDTLEYLLVNLKKSENDDEVELLTLLIEKWDEEHTTFNLDANPVELLEALMAVNNFKAVDIANKLGVSKGLISDILNYKKGFSKEIIRKIAETFKMRQEAFNKPYKLKNREKTKAAHAKSKSKQKT